MRFANEISVDAQADELFAFVSDPEQVVKCLPGASVEGRDGDDWRGAMNMKVGPIKARYRGTLRFLELDPDARRAVMRVRADEANGQGQAEARIVSEIARPLPRVPSGVWWALAGGAVGFDAGWLIGRSQ